MKERRDLELQPRARLQFKIEPERIGWIHAALLAEGQVTLYEGEFPEPLPKLTYLAGHRGDQLFLAAIFETSQDFIERYQKTVGAADDLSNLLKRYTRHEFSPDGQMLNLWKGEEMQGVIARNETSQVLIQQGGPAGNLTISEQTPVNSLQIYLDQFNHLVQRYVNCIWNASSETDQKQISLTLTLPHLPEDAPVHYFSTREIVVKEFRYFPREVTLDDIGGYPQIKDLVKALVMDIANPELSRTFGTQPHSNKFVLVTGEEGTGKSIFPKALHHLLREAYPNLEHFRLRLPDLLTQHGPFAAIIVKTLLEHLEENEKKTIPSLLHLDGLEALVPPSQRSIQRARDQLGTDRTLVGLAALSPAEFQYSLQTINPILVALREFGQELGAQSRQVIVWGESRVRREELPEAIARTFRRAFHLRPTVADLTDILRVQIKNTRQFATKTAIDPFSPDVETHLPSIALAADGLNGRDIQQAILNITTRHKAQWDGASYQPITANELSEELASIRESKGSEFKPKRPLGFDLSRAM